MDHPTQHMLVLVAIQTSTHQMQGDVLESVHACHLQAEINVLDAKDLA